MRAKPCLYRCGRNVGIPRREGALGLDSRASLAPFSSSRLYHCQLDSDDRHSDWNTPHHGLLSLSTLCVPPARASLYCRGRALCCRRRTTARRPRATLPVRQANVRWRAAGNWRRRPLGLLWVWLVWRLPQWSTSDRGQHQRALPSCVALSCHALMDWTALHLHREAE